MSPIPLPTGPGVGKVRTHRPSVTSVTSVSVTDKGGRRNGACRSLQGLPAGIQPRRPAIGLTRPARARVEATSASGHSAPDSRAMRFCPPDYTTRWQTRPACRCTPHGFNSSAVRLRPAASRHSRRRERDFISYLIQSQRLLPSRV